MSDLVNVLDVARRILDVPGGLESVTRREVVALAGFVCQQNEDPRELRLDVPDAPALPASLAAALALAVAAYDGCEGLRKDPCETSGPMHADAEVEFFETFNTLKTRFEKEFPNGSA